MPVTTAKSDKPYKVDEHRKERRGVRTALASGKDDSDPALNRAPYGDPWNGPKDGKQTIDPKSKYMRK